MSYLPLFNLEKNHTVPLLKYAFPFVKNLCTSEGLGNQAMGVGTFAKVFCSFSTRSTEKIIRFICYHLIFSAFQEI